MVRQESLFHAASAARTGCDAQDFPLTFRAVCSTLDALCPTQKRAETPQSTKTDAAQPWQVSPVTKSLPSLRSLQFLSPNPPDYDRFGAGMTFAPCGTVKSGADTKDTLLIAARPICSPIPSASSHIRKCHSRETGIPSTD